MDTCPACLWKCKYSVYEWVSIWCPDFQGDEYVLIDKWGIKEYVCKKCNWTGKFQEQEHTGYKVQDWIIIEA